MSSYGPGEARSAVGQLRGLDLVARRKDGSEFPVEVSLSNVETGEATFVLAFISDFTARRETEARLKTEFLITRVLADSPTLTEAIPWVLRAICECFGWEFGELWRLDSKAHVLRWAGSWHVEGLDAAEFQSISRQMTFASGIGIPGLTEG